jgi:hypothetical protein
MIDVSENITFEPGGDERALSMPEIIVELTMD